jgi:hypothetical protein
VFEASLSNNSETLSLKKNKKYFLSRSEHDFFLEEKSLRKARTKI